MSRIKRDVQIDQNTAADLVRAMIISPPWCEHTWARAALMIAARAIERGRHLTGKEKLGNLMKALREDDSMVAEEQTGAKS